MKTKPLILSLFDATGNMVRPWAEAGAVCYIVDILHPLTPGEPERFPSGGEIHRVNFNLDAGHPDWNLMLQVFVNRKVAFMSAFPPCEDLTSSGALHWKKKAIVDPQFQVKALGRLIECERFAKALGCPYMIENPRAGYVGAHYRQPDHAFDPCDFGLYIPANEAEHPRWPKFIEARDAYTKKTGLWTGGGFIMPALGRVEPVIYSFVSKKTGKTKRGSKTWAKLYSTHPHSYQIRSETPRGTATAMFMANALVTDFEKRAA